ncbi:hypothetical protein HN51_039024 [Arachis hypogaea]|uniref:polygalacturonase-like n=1 Tax=Arachis hypogaea TaxID=3818 RepID=UPI000DEC3E7E|nr:polygalacturonase-like [Arachis hypogaea]
MNRYLLLFSFFVSSIVVPFVGCYNAKLQKGPLVESTNVEDDYNINDRSWWRFKGLVMQSKDVVGGDRTSSSSSSHLRKVINVNDYGACGDGGDASSNTQAFEKAWQTACSSGKTILLVPKGNIYQLKPIRFSGPCKSDIQVQIEGTIEATDEASDYYSNDSKYWLVFDNVKKLLVHGGGTIDGNGKIWWQKSCKRDKTLPCKDAPTALTFSNCSNLRVENLYISNAQQMHVRIQGCKNVIASGINVTAPGDSPNTDGIHVTNSHNVQISDSVIGTGDDCISIVSGSKNILATNITCGPGHGISIGSLGKGNSEAYVSGVTVKRAQISGTTNGVRIKTWQGGSGLASYIQFKHIVMENVTNPILIDQNYCDKPNKSCPKQKSAVQISNVLYQNISGTSASDVAVKFDCSDSVPCQDIILEDINLQSFEGDKDAEALCNNVKVSYYGDVNPSCCS